MRPRIVILGAGFGGLELSTLLSGTFGDGVEVTLIDKSDAFVFGFSKLDVMFGQQTPEAVRLPYRDFAKPGVRLLRETVTAIDPAARRVTTDAGTHEADILVVALGADYDFAATPGLAEAQRVLLGRRAPSACATCCPASRAGHAVIGVCGAPYKCPPAPSECALMLHDYLVESRRARALRDHARAAAVEPGAALAGDLDGADRRVRRARHHVHARPTRRLGRRRRAAWRRLDDGTRAALRPVPRRSQAPRARRSCWTAGMRRGRLDSGESAHARDQVPGRLRGRRRRQHGHAEGRRVRRRRGAAPSRAT